VTAPAPVAELTAATGAETGTLLSPDCLTVWFCSTRDGTADLFTATRTDPAGTWNAPTKMSFSTATFGEQDPWMSNDQRTFVFSSNALGTYDVYMATR
jgi:Tol biopolymer transport system component